MTDQALLRVDRVSFSYGGEPAVQDVSLAVGAGDFVGLIGPNGSGKSTLMRIAVGLLRPGAGRVELFGQPISRFRHWERLGYVPQSTSARPGFPATVAEVVSTGRTARRGLFRRLTVADRRLVDRSLDSVGMAPFARRLIGALSGGQHQRVMLARALAGEPDLLLLDEPAAGVDAAAKLEILNLLRCLCADSGLGVLYVSHDLETLRPYLTRVALVNRRLVFFGTRDDLVARPDVLKQFFEAALTAGEVSADHHVHSGGTDQ